MTAEKFKIEAKRLRPALMSVALGYLKDADEAEDMVQDAMLKLWTMCAELRSPIAPLARVLTRNLCIDRQHRIYTLQCDQPYTINSRRTTYAHVTVTIIIKYK